MVLALARQDVVHVLDFTFSQLIVVRERRQRWLSGQHLRLDVDSLTNGNLDASDGGEFDFASSLWPVLPLPAMRPSFLLVRRDRLRSDVIFQIRLVYFLNIWLRRRHAVLDLRRQWLGVQSCQGQRLLYLQLLPV